VATQTNHVYAFDAEVGGAALWEVDFATTPSPSRRPKPIPISAMPMPNYNVTQWIGNQ